MESDPHNSGQTLFSVFERKGCGVSVGFFSGEKLLSDFHSSILRDVLSLDLIFYGRLIDER
jgi:hypothetical protein